MRPASPIIAATSKRRCFGQGWRGWLAFGVVAALTIFGKAPAMATENESFTVNLANANFSLPYHAEDLGGGRMQSAVFTMDVVLGSIGGIGRSSDFSIWHGYTGQLNDPPALVDPGPKTVTEDSELSFTLTANVTDADPDRLEWSASSLPSRAVFDPRTARFRWTPSQSQGPGVYRVTFRVLDDGISELIDEREVTITVNEANDPPTVTIQSIKDEIGRELGGNRKVLVGQRIFLTGSFRDTDPPGSHTTTLNWGDSPGSAIGPFNSGQTIKADHVYTRKNTYSIALTVKDSGNLSDTARRTITVVQPSEGLLDVVEALSALLRKPFLKNKVARYVQKALDDLVGHNDGRSDDGALDKLERGRLDDALELIANAIEHIEEVQDESNDRDVAETLEDVKLNLALAAAAIVGEAVEDAAEGVTRPGDLQKIAQARALLSDAMDRIQRADFFKAMNKLRDVLGLLDSLPPPPRSQILSGGTRLQIQRTHAAEGTIVIQLGLSGPAGTTVGLEQSSDLSRWEQVETIVISAQGTAQLERRTSGDSKPVFYRLRSYREGTSAR